MASPHENEVIAKELTIQALDSPNASLAYAKQYNGKDLGEFAGAVYAAVLKAVKAANAE